MAVIKKDGGYNALPISYKRGNPIPLDTTAVWYSESELKNYAKTSVVAYVGQVLTLVNETANTATAYVILNTAGDIEKIGTAPIGDEKSISVAANGTVSLYGITGLDFDKKNENGETVTDSEGNPVKVTYQPLMTESGLTWVIPSETTVEGLSSLISGLSERVGTLEANVGKDNADANSATGIYGLIRTEIKTRTDEVNTINTKIGTVEDGTNLVTMISEVDGKIPTSLTGLDNSVTKYQSDTQVQNAIDTSIANKADKATTLAGYGITDAYTKTQTDTKIAEEIGKQAHFSAKVVTSVDQMTESAVLYLMKTAATGDDLYEEWLLIDGTATKIGTTATDLSDYVTNGALTTKLAPYALIANTISSETFEGFKTTNTGAINDAKQAGLDASAALNEYKDTVTTALSGKADKATTLAGYGITDAYTKSETYTKTEVGDLINQITGGDFENTATSVKQALDNYIKSNDTELYGSDVVNSWTVDNKYTPNYSADSRIDKLNNTLTTLNSSAIKDVKVNNTSLTVTNNSVNITPDSLGVYTKTNIDNKLGTVPADTNIIAITDALSSRLDTTTNTATNADTLSKTNATAISGHASRISSLEADSTQNATDHEDYVTRISALEAADTKHSGEYNTLNSTVQAHTTAIAGKADQTELDKSNNNILSNTNAIKDINENKLPAINSTLESKANSADVYTKDKVYTKEQIGTLAKDENGADKTVVQMIDTVQSSVNAEVSRATGIEAGFETRISANETTLTRLIGTHENDNTRSIREIAANEIAKIVNDNSNGSIDTLNEIAAWIVNDSTGAAKMNADIAKNTNSIDSITTKLFGISGTVKDYVDGKVSAIPVASNTLLGLVMGSTADNKISINSDGTMEVNSLNVNRLKQTEGEELILCGGTAVVTTDPEGSESEQ